MLIAQSNQFQWTKWFSVLRDEEDNAEYDDYEGIFSVVVNWFDLIDLLLLNCLIIFKQNKTRLDNNQEWLMGIMVKQKISVEVKMFSIFYVQINSRSRI